MAPLRMMSWWHHWSWSTGYCCSLEVPGVDCWSDVRRRDLWRWSSASLSLQWGLSHGRRCPVHRWHCGCHPCLGGGRRSEATSAGQHDLEIRIHVHIHVSTCIYSELHCYHNHAMLVTSGWYIHIHVHVQGEKLYHHKVHCTGNTVERETLVSIKFGESVIRMHWRILNLAIASASA